jgi:hypothetical protein
MLKTLEDFVEGKETRKCVYPFSPSICGQIQPYSLEQELDLQISYNHYENVRNLRRTMSNKFMSFDPSVNIEIIKKHQRSNPQSILQPFNIELTFGVSKHHSGKSRPVLSREIEWLYQPLVDALTANLLRSSNLDSPLIKYQQENGMHSSLSRKMNPLCPPSISRKMNHLCLPNLLSSLNLPRNVLNHAFLSPRLEYHHPRMSSICPIHQMTGTLQSVSNNQL